MRFNLDFRQSRQANDSAIFEKRANKSRVPVFADFNYTDRANGTTPSRIVTLSLVSIF